MITQDDISALESDGYVILRSLLDPDRDLRPFVSEYHDLIDRLIANAAADDPPSRDAGIDEKMSWLMVATGGTCQQTLDFSLPQAGVTQDTPIHLGPAVFDLLRNNASLDAVEAIIGPEIYSVPVQHTRFKLPEHKLTDSSKGTALAGATNWHQDLGVLLPEADDSRILSVWFPLTPVNEKTGCLLVIPGSHQGPLLHHDMTFMNISLSAGEVDESKAIALPMDVGDVLIFHRRTAHASLPNQSNSVRWSVDLRYSPIGHATGRPWFPGFVARSRESPASILTDHRAWADAWREARAKLAVAGDVRFQRW